ncbi:MAG: rod shape-determining protein MreC [Acidobacteria bacterium]|nr:rod shape-determining protein MreC [Acidobacteriota bacterium]
MIAFPSRNRPLTLLAGVMLAQVLLLALQIRNENQVQLIRVWAVYAVTPVQRAGLWVVDGIGDWWNNYVALRKTRQENQSLREEISGLKIKSAQLESRAAEADRLGILLQFRESHPDVPLLAAKVIGAAAVGTSKTIYINRGIEDKVAKNMGVITPDGVVGKIYEVYSNSSQVLLMTDKDSGVGSLLASSRTQGVVRGTGDPEPALQYVINDEKVEAGERILTSGLDKIFPKDLPVGTVVSATSGNPFKKITVRTAVRLDRLEEVLVLLTRQEFAPKEPPQEATKPESKKP